MNRHWNLVLGNKDPVTIVEWDKCFTLEWNESSAPSVMQVPELSVTSDAGVQCHLSFFPNALDWRLDQWLLCIGNTLTQADGALSHPRKNIQGLP